jgi:hypothetical protein
MTPTLFLVACAGLSGLTVLLMLAFPADEHLEHECRHGLQSWFDPGQNQETR